MTYFLKEFQNYVFSLVSQGPLAQAPSNVTTGSMMCLIWADRQKQTKSTLVQKLIETNLREI